MHGSSLSIIMPEIGKSIHPKRASSTLLDLNDLAELNLLSNWNTSIFKHVIHWSTKNHKNSILVLCLTTVETGANFIGPRNVTQTSIILHKHYLKYVQSLDCKCGRYHLPLLTTVLVNTAVFADIYLGKHTATTCWPY